MLLSLLIKNYALIDELEIGFTSGFLTITGETGTGKSIILGAISLLLGQRADTSVLRNPDKKSIVEAEFDISKFNIKHLFQNNDLEWDDHLCIRREIAPGGKSRAFVNDTPVNLSVLKEIGDNLIDIHSQHENLLLRSDEFQLYVLDAVADNKNDLQQYQNDYKQYTELKKRLQQLQQSAAKSKDDLEYNQYQFDELDRARLVSGEQEELENELKVLQNSETILTAFGTAFHSLKDGEDNVVTLLKRLVSEFETVAAFHSGAKTIRDRLESAGIELMDVSDEIEKVLDSFSIDPERLQYVNDRIDLIFSLQQKHKVHTIDQLLEIKEQLEEDLLLAGDFEGEIEKIKKKIEQTEIILQKSATKLSEKRKEAAKALKQKLEQYLKKLGIKYPLFDAQFEKSEQYTEYGYDSVLFFFAANKNISPLPISQVASGGEISRVMLCLKYTISEKRHLPTIIFDEIDTGVSGEIAYNMGQLMNEMSENMQIISITHLPQIAALGNEQYKVYKHEEENTTYTNIKKLNADERVGEIAQMISGTIVTDAAIQNAKELLKIK